MPTRSFVVLYKWPLVVSGILVTAMAVPASWAALRPGAGQSDSARIPEAQGPGATQPFDPLDPREVPVPRPASWGGRVAGTAPRGIVTRGKYTSVQVNVDEDGNDIIGDAANEPTIAVDPIQPSRMAVAWRQFDTIANSFREAGMGHTTDWGATWTAGKVEPGQFRSDPVLSFDRQGNFFFSSLSSATSVELFRSYDGGATWLGPVDAHGGDKQWMTVDRTTGIGSGNIYQIWNSQFSCCGTTDFTRSIDAGLSFQFPLSLPVPKIKWGQVDVGPDGTVYMAGSSLGGTEHYFLSSSNAKDRTQIPAFSPITTINLGGPTVSGGEPNPGGLLGQVSVATNLASGPHHGEIYVLGSVNPPGIDPLDVMFIRSTDGGATWSTPVRINDDAVTSWSWQWFGTMAVSPSGRIDVVWNDTRNDQGVDESELYHSYSIDGGQTWAVNEPLSPPFNHFLGYPSQSKLGDYYQMVSDARGAHLAYAATFTGGQDVYYLLIPGDCNLNGVDDAIDIANKTSADCTGNGVPDECEADCNGNGNADSCDILAGSSSDCTENEIPDECESDCNGNAVADVCEIQSGTVDDENENAIPDSCEAILYVRKEANGKQTGLNWRDAYTSLQSALQHAAASDGIVSSIWVAAGTYVPSQSDRNVSFAVPPGLAVFGGFSGNETQESLRNWRRNPTILSGDILGDDQPFQGNRSENSIHVVTINGGIDPAYLSGLIITGGNADGSSPNDWGGGVFMDSASGVIEQCAIVDNNSFSRGGGLFVSNAEVSLESCLVARNISFDGAAILATRNSTISMAGCTVAYNTGGLAALNGDFGSSALYFFSSIAWGNTDFSETTEESQIFGFAETHIDHSSVEGWSGMYGGGGNNGSDPLFVDLDGADGTPGTLDDNFRLAPGSPAIDTANVNGLVELLQDLDGHPRGLCEGIDRGAYEFGIGDYDCNGFVNLADVVLLPPCLLGPMMQLEDTCEAFDFDADADVDLIDYGLLQSSLTE